MLLRTIGVQVVEQLCKVSSNVPQQPV